jgi:hypothetical protein
MWWLYHILTLTFWEVSHAACLCHSLPLIPCVMACQVAAAAAVLPRLCSLNAGVPVTRKMLPAAVAAFGVHTSDDSLYLCSFATFSAS